MIVLPYSSVSPWANPPFTPAATGYVWTGSQARIVFGIMQRMVKRTLALREAGLTVYANAIMTLDGSARPINARP
jgi:hypothetical protein